MSEAYTKGEHAYVSGKSLSDNPYRFMGDETEEANWYRGWMDASKKSRGEDTDEEYRPKKAEQDGKKAFKKGETLDKCPFNDPILKDSWEKGWEKAKKHARQNLILKKGLDSLFNKRI